MTTRSSIPALAEQRRLLRLEYEAEKQSYQELADRMGIVRLVGRGHARYPLRAGRLWYNSFNHKSVELFAETECVSDDENSFEPGRPVIVFTVEDTGRQTVKRLFAATISFVDGDRVVLVVPDGTDTSALLASGISAGIMLSFDETTYRAMFETLDKVASAKGRLAELRDFIYSGRRAGEYLLPPMSFPYLNPVQQQAVNRVLRAKEVSIVHGPPGTGKTTTLVEAIYETLRREPQTLVCAQSNIAVDRIAELLVDRGIKVVRIGNPSRVNDKMLSMTYERRFESHPEYPVLWSIRKAIRELYAGRHRGSESVSQKINRLRSRAADLELRIRSDIFSDARVIASTLVGSGSGILEGMTFPTLFIDEAAQALEAAAWIAIRKAGRVIFAGDHCQLPPVVKDNEALKGGLGRSLMERVAENHPETVTLLSVQYRMNEEIMRFSSDWFYGGAMKAAPEVASRSILPYDRAIDWIDTSSPTYPEIDSSELPDSSENSYFSDLPSDPSLYREQLWGVGGYGRINREEAVLTVGVLKSYIERIGRTRMLEENIDFGIISPYRAQTSCIRGLIKRDSFFRPYMRQIAVSTVDGFQGRERDVIVISMVRSNDEGQIGFLRDLRRMNVAMTRARMKLIIVGNGPTLSRHPFYRRLLEYITSQDDAGEVETPAPRC